MEANGIAGVVAAGPGSAVRLQACRLAANRGTALHAIAGATAELDGCKVGGRAGLGRWAAAWA